jgi:hypothetical protein
MPVRCFPPPSNAAYEKALHAQLAKRWDEEESEIEAEAAREKRLRVQRLKIMVVPQDGYFTEVRKEVDRSENWRPGGVKTEDGEQSMMKGMSAGLGIEGILRERGRDRHSRTIKDEETGEIEVFTEARETQEGEGNDHPTHSGKHPEDEDADDSDEGLFMRQDLSRGERLAQNINFRRDTWITTAPGVSGDILPAEEQREDFIDDINNNGEQLGFCTVCKMAHIPPGPPITLADRDTCGSFLPKWFPAQLLARPWDTYRRLINELVALDEKSQEQRDRGQDPNKPRWDLEWHEADAEWVAAGRHEGWWKCRSGPDAPPVERHCRVCHRVRGPGEQALTVAEEDEMREERKKVLQGFIDQQVKMFGEMDKEIALAKIQLESMGLIDRPVGEGGGRRGGVTAEGEQVLTAPDATEAMTRAVEEMLGPDTGEVVDSGESDSGESVKLTPESIPERFPFSSEEHAAWN